MRIADTTIKKLLLDNKKITPEQLSTLEEEATRSKRPLQDILVQKEIVSEADLVKLFAESTGIPFVELKPDELTQDVITKIPERIARQYNVILFRIDPDGLMHLAMEDPDDVQAVDFIKKQIGDKVKIYLATHENILNCLEIYRGDVNEQLNDVIDVQREDDASAQQVSEADISEDSPIAQTINLLLEYAIRSSASDIHIEPRENFVQIRYRIDGVLKEVNRLPRSVLGALISRIKILSNLKIDEHRVPQDGRFKIKVGSKQYALRVSTLPISDGEKIVMRILDESSEKVTLEELGYWGKSLATLNEALTVANGIILITGPTGSGKSTSLFSILTLLNTPDVNISTIEDPVEYKIPGVNQTQANDKIGMSFAAGLRSLLRQDPNIIMVGEIRDGETANLAVQAALTGHLVFSTLHTNDAATSLPRLLDMNVEPFLISSTVRAVVGQRLVRKLCTTCRQSYAPDEKQFAAIKESFGLDDTAVHQLHELEVQAKNANVGEGVEEGSTDTGIKTLWRPSPEGCEECHGTGFRGRVGIYEVLQNSSAVQKLIISNATSNQIKDQATSEGMLTMQLDGLIKSLRGVTTVEEVLRATKE